MRTAIIIPARLAAARLPGKPLRILGKVPLVVRVAQQAQKCQHVDDVVVATDASEVLEAVTAHGLAAVITRADHASGTDRVAEAAASLGVDYVVNLQGDEPFVDPDDLRTVAMALKSSKTDMVTLCAPITDPAELHDPDVVKVVSRDDGQALYFSRAPIPFARDASLGPAGTFRHIGIYGYTRAALNRLATSPTHPVERRESLEQLRALAMGMSIAVLPARTTARGIDTEDDLAWARRRVESLGEAAFP
jgi:3-deoxy-manno-octulosonate cytidylyltransferase (CMP-KDO synthetase)